jgi:uncharacterized protein (TIGR03086 family)
MSVADRYRKVAAGFTEQVRTVPADAWERPSPCEGWVARDVVRHLVEWVPGFLAGGAALETPAIPSVDADPLTAWQALDGWLQSLLDDPATDGLQHNHAQTGSVPLHDAIARFVMGDVLVHTWDLARAVGRDVVLDADEVHGMRVGLEPITEMLEQSGHYGRAVPLPDDDASEQDRLIALTGRRPDW